MYWKQQVKYVCNILGIRSSCITTTAFCPCKFLFDIRDYKALYSSFSPCSQIYIHLIFPVSLQRGSFWCCFLASHSKWSVLRFQHYKVFPWILGWTAAKLQKPGKSPPYNLHFSFSPLCSHQLSSLTGRMSQHKQKWLGQKSNQKATSRGRATERFCLLVGLNRTWYCTAQNRPPRTCPTNRQKTAFVVMDPQLFSD